MRDIVTTLLNVADKTASGEGSVVDTIGSRNVKSDLARVFLNCTSLTGTTPTADVTVVWVDPDGVEHVVGTFTQLTTAGKENITITACPDRVKAKYTLGGTVTDFDAKAYCVRI